MWAGRERSRLAPMNARRRNLALCAGAFVLGLLGAIFTVSLVPRYGILLALACLGAAFAAAFVFQALERRSRLAGAHESEGEPRDDRGARKRADGSGRGLRSGRA
jgi:hypothetical protein